VDAEIVDHVDATLLQFTSEVAAANLVRVVGDTLDVLSTLARRPVSSAELARVREGYRFSLLAQLDDATAMAEWFGAALLFREPERPSTRLARMSRVSARDVMLAARSLARPEGLALAAVGPVSRVRLRELRSVASRYLTPAVS
jgi:predicted Zn-dependent peptidase